MFLPRAHIILRVVNGILSPSLKKSTRQVTCQLPTEDQSSAQDQDYAVLCSRSSARNSAFFTFGRFCYTTLNYIVTFHSIFHNAHDFSLLTRLYLISTRLLITHVSDILVTHLWLTESICLSTTCGQVMTWNYNIINSNLYYWHAKTAKKPEKMQGNDDLQSFFGLISSTLQRSYLRNKFESQEIPCVDDSSSEDE